MSKADEINEWVKKAQGDLAIAKLIFKQSRQPWAACFHCQQAVEKILKAAQIYFINNFDKEHDLELLINSLNNYIDKQKIDDNIETLSSYYISARYPGPREDIITQIDAQEAIKSTEKIFKYLKRIISQ